MPFDPTRLGDVTAAFDLGDDARIVAGPSRGEQGQVWRVDSSRGTFAVKELFERWAEPAVATAAGYQEAVAAAGVIAPRIVRTTGGHVLHQLTDGPTMRVYSWVDLREPDSLLDPHAVGAIVAAIHRVRRTADESVHPWYTEAVGADRWEALARAAHDHGAPFAADLRRLVPEMIALEAFRSDPVDLQLCHSDLWADNLRSMPDRSPCVIDWENCGMADPRQELTLVLYEFGGSSSSRTIALHHAYLDAGGPFGVSDPRHFWMLIAQLMHINERCISLWLAEGATAEQREHVAAGFDQYVQRPLTPALIERMLDAIS